MKRLFLMMSGFAFLLTACELSLAGDITPPPEAIISAQSSPEPIVYPSSAPDPANGEVIYAERCAPCHGVSGLGDGEQADELAFFPAPIGDSELARENSPEDWYRIVTGGRLARFMPPFAAALEPQERWEVLAYVYGLGLDAAELDRGAELYAQHQGEVDGLLREIYPLAVKQSVIEPLGLSATDSAALTAFLQARALGLEATMPPDAEDIETPSAASEIPTLGSFSGKVMHGSGDWLPTGLQATLFGFDHTEVMVTETADVGPDGAFVFSQIPLAEGRIFFFQVEYKGQIYFSEFVTPQGESTQFELPIIIYETTSNASQLAAESLQLVYDFYKAGVVRVVQRVSISNLGDRAVVPDEAGKPVLHFRLPPQAINLAFEEGALGDRYVAEEDGFGDLRGVLPGKDSYQLLFAYELPYHNGLSYEVTIDLPTRSVVILLPESGFELPSEDFQLIGRQPIEGTAHAVFAAEAGYLPSDTIPITIRGAHPLGGGGLGWLADDELLVGLAALTAAVGVLWLSVRGASASKSEQIMEEIIALDERYDDGKGNKANYRKQRRLLKERLRRSLARGRKP